MPYQMIIVCSQIREKNLKLQMNKSLTLQLAKVYYLLEICTNQISSLADSFTPTLGILKS